MDLVVRINKLASDQRSRLEELHFQHQLGLQRIVVEPNTDWLRASRDCEGSWICSSQGQWCNVQVLDCERALTRRHRRSRNQSRRTMRKLNLVSIGYTDHHPSAGRDRQRAPLLLGKALSET